MEDTEARMHETADKVRSPQREALHRRARRVTERARQHEKLAEEIREHDTSPPPPKPRAEGD
jgi:hypothetical protein